MNRIFNFLFPALMVVGMLISGFVIVTSLQAAASPNAAPAQIQPASQTSSREIIARGRALFVAKGCVVCHRHDNVAAYRAMDFQFDNVPNLTNTKLNAEYLDSWLKDPQSIKPNAEMPNLKLEKAEIDALVAFLTANRK